GARAARERSEQERETNGHHEAEAGGDEANKVGLGEADAYIVFDLLTGTNPANLDKALAGKTVAVVSSSKVPTTSMVRDTSAEFPEWTAFQRVIDESTSPERNVYFDAGTLSDSLFRSHMPANVLVVGAAYQAGVVPISASAIERAIELNGVAVEMNTQAFRIGRKIVLDPDFLGTLEVERVGKVKREIGPSGREQDLIDAVPNQSEELARLLRIRVPDLVAYQNHAYAAAYASFIAEVREAEAAAGSETALSEAVATYLYKLMAYKDEYEVARLHRSKAFQQAVRDQFGDKTDVTYKLHPPIMRRMGVEKKIGLGRSGDMAFALLARMKGLRGGALDVFGRTAHRKMERELIDEYRGMIERALDTLGAGDEAAYARAVEIARLPDMIRGYEEIKENNVELFRARATELGA
ncbi:MAG: 2-oxoacid:acceptor oxidoreductase family protein, partial [Acidimicrobiaceae bacterium]|nr:2-oxoacid:acceptor oxidoreductase family protein [Acidimicrobiaceae bacterium]